VRQIFGGVTGHVTEPAVIGLGTVLAKPVVSVPQLDNAAAVGLDVLVAVIRPDRAGVNDLRGGGSGCEERTEKGDPEKNSPGTKRDDLFYSHAFSSGNVKLGGA
jgi:hypothetical protein